MFCGGRHVFVHFVWFTVNKWDGKDFFSLFIMFTLVVMEFIDRLINSYPVLISVGDCEPRQQLVDISVRIDIRLAPGNLGSRTRSWRRAWPFSRAWAEHMALRQRFTREPPVQNTIHEFISITDVLICIKDILQNIWKFNFSFSFWNFIVWAKNKQAFFRMKRWNRVFGRTISLKQKGNYKILHILRFNFQFSVTL